MFCQFCGNKLDDIAVFCPQCGKKIIKISNANQQYTTGYNQDNILNQDYDKKNKVARAMASLFFASGFFWLIFGIVSSFFAIIMQLAKSEIDFESEEVIVKAYNLVIVLYVVFSIVAFISCVIRIIDGNQILKNNQYNANKVYKSFASYGSLFFLKFMIKSKNYIGNISKYNVLFFALIICVIICDLTIVIYMIINTKSFPYEFKDIEDEIPEYVEQWNEWDDKLKLEKITPIDEKDDLYLKYMKMRKDRLVEILDKQEDYEKKAVVIAKYVYYKRFCNYN